MKSLLKFLFLPLLFLAACKKDNQYQTLSVTGMSSMAFASGDAISIYGSGFDTIPDNNTVSFDGVAGEVATSTPNRLQVIVPVLTGSGQITVKTHGQSATSTQSYTLVNVLQGTYTNNLTLTPDKKYLIRGAVIFNAKLIIQPGTVIYGEKLTHGSLTCNDIDWQGTAAQPIVFTSDQAPGSRAPGDWGGIITIQGGSQANTNTPVPIGIMEYVRVEYAGYTATPAVRGQALLLFTDQGSVMRYIQVSYSAGDGISTYEGVSNATFDYYLEHLIAFGCEGDDFRFTTAAGTVQYALGLKDPYLANSLQGNGITISDPEASQSPVVVSNFTLIGYDPAARNIAGGTGLPLTQNAGRGVKVGDVLAEVNNNPQAPAPGSISTESFAMYNSVIAGSWQAAVSIYGNPHSYYYPSDWDSYEDSAYITTGGDIVSFRNNFITGTAGQALPYRGGVFGREAYTTSNYNFNGFEDISGTIQQQLFGYFNDTTRTMDLTAGQDPLGIKGLADYTQINHPTMLPAAGSPLLTGAVFGATTPANTPQLNKDITYIGAFGTTDWTAGWSNFNPQQTKY